GPLRLAGDAVPDPHRDVLPDHLGRRAGTGGDVVARLLLRDRRVAGGGDARDLQAGVALGRPVIRIRTPVDGRELDVGARDRGAGRDAEVAEHERVGDLRLVPGDVGQSRVLQLDVRGSQHVLGARTDGRRDPLDGVTVVGVDGDA